jgi:hypothetical protein
MKITKDNYFSEIEKIGVDELPEELLQAHELISDKTNIGRDWGIYETDTEVKDVIDLAFEKLGELIDYRQSLSSNEEELGAIKKNKKVSDLNPYGAAKELIMPYMLRGDDISSISKSMMGANTSEYSAYVKGGKIHVTEINGKKVDKAFSLMDVFQDIRKEKAGLAKKGEDISAKMKLSERVSEKHLKNIITHETERISEEVRFIRRFIAMQGKTKEKKQILAFIDSLQKAMLEKRIRKTSPLAKQVLYVQEFLLKIYNSMSSKIKIELGKNTVEQFIKIGKSEKVRPSVQLIKRYIGIQGKSDKVEQAERLCKTMERAAKKRLVTKEDPYAHELNAVWLILKIARDKKGGKKFLVQKGELQGLFGEPAEESPLGEIPEEVEEKQKQESEKEEQQSHLMCSTDFANMEFTTIGLTGKWLELIGDPCKGFTAMVFGKPKMGKSYLCIDFASYLAATFGKVLYVAREEKLDATLQKKLSDKQAFNPNLFVSDSLPEDLSPYDFIFLDSVNKLGLSPKDIETLRIKSPGKSFLCIFQTTKDGHFKGKNEFQHDVDAVIEIPERGKAIQYGRFNQGGEMDIFQKQPELIQEEETPETNDLQGLDKNSMFAGTNKKAMKEKRKASDLQKYADRSDDLNPQFIFSLTSTQVLCEVLTGEFDLDYCARRELANRGVDGNGQWIGFEQAKKLHKV